MIHEPTQEHFTNMLDVEELLPGRRERAVARPGGAKQSLEGSRREAISGAAVTRPNSDRVLRAVARVEAGEHPRAAAQAEGTHPSTVYRALAKMRTLDRPRVATIEIRVPAKQVPVSEQRRLLVVVREGAEFNTWIESEQTQDQIGQDIQCATIDDLLGAITGLVTKI